MFHGLNQSSICFDQLETFCLLYKRHDKNKIFFKFLYQKSVRLCSIKAKYVFWRCRPIKLCSIFISFLSSIWKSFLVQYKKKHAASLYAWQFTIVCTFGWPHLDKESDPSRDQNFVIVV